MKVLLSTIALIALTSSTAFAGEKAKLILGGDLKSAKEFNGKVGVSLSNKTNDFAIIGKTQIKNADHKEGAKAQYTYTSKSGKTKVKAKLGMDDFSNSQSVSGGFEINLDLN